MIFNIFPIHILRALSTALELSNGGLSRHHLRTAMISREIAEQIGLDDYQQQILTYAALMHDLGAAASWSERQKLSEVNPGREVYRHAENGYLLLKDSPQLGVLAKPIRHHHDWWDGSSPSGLAGRDIPLLSRIINLADRLEVMLKDDKFVFGQRPYILTTLNWMSGTCFEPDLVQTLQEIAKRESFWLDLVNPHHCQNFFASADVYGGMRFQIDDILNIAEIFATVIDNTSKFTGRHSRSVAEVAAFLAQIKGYCAEEIKLMRIAGLLHDLGKLSIPNEILEKPGKLTEEEFAIIKQHPYYTYRILEQINGLETIAEWAAYHHESLDGLGYPFGKQASNLQLGSRIIRVADVFAALAEERPYRGIMPLVQVERIMLDMVEEQKLDGVIVQDLFANKEEAYSLMKIQGN